MAKMKRFKVTKSPEIMKAQQSLHMLTMLTLI